MKVRPADARRPFAGRLVEVRSRAAWRSWLRRHHASSRGIWLVFNKQHTGRPTLAYEDAVREALCFGWIDSLITRLDDDRYARKFTPRTATSRWSEINRRRWNELEAAGLLAAPGRAAAPTGRAYAARTAIPQLPSYIAAAFRSNAKAWAFFQQLAPTYRRHYVAWIHTAKQPATRERRIRESIALLASGQKLGLR